MWLDLALAGKATRVPFTAECGRIRETRITIKQMCSAVNSGSLLMEFMYTSTTRPGTTGPGLLCNEPRFQGVVPISLSL